ncbi:hypothetical protein GF327_01990 [Candidatus Woesearchaeota archaeon]|nr:hypothetical protein [Candidatus Woesearchaeota archaeon]
MTEFQLADTDTIDRKVFEAISGFSPEPISHIFEPIETPFSYDVLTAEAAANKLFEKGDIAVVTGGTFGDEGKGFTVDLLAKFADFVFRANSGENAGHTVYYTDKDGDRRSFVFHLAPSGTLNNDIINFIGPKCVMDPVNFYKKEIEPLYDIEMQGGEKWAGNNLFIGNVKLVAPYHKIMDFIGKPPLSSTLMGMSEAHGHMYRKKGLRLNDVFNLSKEVQIGRILEELEDYDKELKKYAQKVIDSDDLNLSLSADALEVDLEKIDKNNLFDLVYDNIEKIILQRCEKENEDVPGRIPDHLLEFLKHDGSMEDKAEFIYDLFQENIAEIDFFQNQRGDVVRRANDLVRQGKKGVIEGAQSYFLAGSKAVPTWKAGTSADTSFSGTLGDSGINAHIAHPVPITVFKVWQSRVGRGEHVGGFVPQTWFIDQEFKSRDHLEGRCLESEKIQKQFISSILENGILAPTVYTDLDEEEYLIGEAAAINFGRDCGEYGATTGNPRVLGFPDLVLWGETLKNQGPYFSISALDRFDGYEKIPLVVAWLYNDLEGNKSPDEKYSNGDLIKPGDELPDESLWDKFHPIIKLVDGWEGNIEGKEPGDNLPQGFFGFCSEVENILGQSYKGEAEQYAPRIFSVGVGVGDNNRIYLDREYN